MIEKLLPKSLVVWAEFDDEYGQEQPVIVSRDAGGSVVLSQEGRDIVVSPKTVPGINKALKRAAKDEI